LRDAAALYRQLARHGLELNAINIGGGFPTRYQTEVPPLRCYASTIAEALGDAFGSWQPALLLEPGRSLVADAGVIQSEIILIARKSRRDDTRWVYLDVGKLAVWRKR
jgi:ornithine decarboxylase